MKRSVRDDEPPQVAVATLDARAYYALTSLMKTMNLPFSSITPGEPRDIGVKLVLTTQSEKRRINEGEEENVLCIEDLTGGAAAVKEKIFSILYSGGDDILVIGIDPGEKTGIAAYYRDKEIVKEIARSYRDTLTKVETLIRESKAERKIIRIGDGNPKIAREIAYRLLQKFNSKIEVEIVDERGTSTITKLLPTGETRDLRSARMISLRRGRPYHIA
ncbi:MAG: hypothetical protein M1503_04905 [Thaumarchaeota archaeon]|nr:hypothetical protein [Nitrososphaerota archaeon]MCL5317591.1 hypothetical protein [Nitrososphaerota archaeon]